MLQVKSWFQLAYEKPEVPTYALPSVPLAIPARIDTPFESKIPQLSAARAPFRAMHPSLRSSSFGEPHGCSHVQARIGVARRARPDGRRRRPHARVAHRDGGAGARRGVLASRSASPAVSCGRFGVGGRSGAPLRPGHGDLARDQLRDFEEQRANTLYRLPDSELDQRRRAAARASGPVIRRR